MSEFIKCPKCNHSFDVTVQMRSSIEKDVRSEIAQEVRDETLAESNNMYNHKIQSYDSEISNLKNIINEVSSERDQLKVSKIELDNIKLNHENEIADAKAQAKLDAKKEFNQIRETIINTLIEQETELRDLRIKELELTL